MMKKQKRQKSQEKEEKKEIKILHTVREDPGKIKEEKRKEQVFDTAALETFIAPRDEERNEEMPVALLRSEIPVENLEEELALVPRSPTQEETTVKYGPASGLYGGEGGYGNLGYGNIQYEANNKYQSGMEPMRGFGGEENRERPFVPRNLEVERVQQTTKSVQDRAMDYSSRIKPEEEKKRKRAEG